MNLSDISKSKISRFDIFFQEKSFSFKIYVSQCHINDFDGESSQKYDAGLK